MEKNMQGKNCKQNVEVCVWDNHVHDQSMISFVNSDPAIKINTHFEQDIEIDFELLDM